MEGLLHPVGPENVRTYWIRRCAALLVVVVLVIGVSSMIGSLASRGDSVAAEPDVNSKPDVNSRVEPVSPPREVVEEEAVPVPSSAARQLPAEEPTQAPPVQEPEPVPAVDAEPAQPAEESQPSEEHLRPELENTFHSVETAKLATGSRPALCDPKAMRVTLEGPKEVRQGVPVMYGIGATNTSDSDCTLQISDETFELAISSGNDRIWSSLDCVAGMPPRGAVLAPGRSMHWEDESRANRSAPQSESSPESMGSGTYVATAKLAGAAPAQWVMQFEV